MVRNSNQDRQLKKDTQSGIDSRQNKQGKDNLQEQPDLGQSSRKSDKTANRRKDNFGKSNGQ